MPNVPKKPDHRPPQYKFRKKQIFKPSVDCFFLSKTDMLQLSDTKI